MSTTLTKVSPRPETNDDNSPSKLNISIKHDNHTEGGGNTPTEKRVFPLKTMDSSKSFASTSKSKHTRGDNESTRSKTSKSARNKSDVFEIDDHIDRLADKLQKDYRSRSKASNEWNAKKPALTRFLMCSCLRAPRMFSATEICSYARIGDLLLFREGVTFESEYLSPEVLRGVKSSLDGKYIPKTRYIKLWNKIGIVVSLKSEHDDEFIKYILHADDIGLKLRKLSEVTNSCVISRDLCSLRPVCIKNKKNQQLYSEFVDDLESIALLARDGKLLWSNFEKVDAHKNDDKATLEEDIALVLDNPKLTRFSGLYTQRMHRLSYSPSLEGVQEATRLFYSIMAVHQHNGNNTVLHSSQKLSMADKSEEDFIPLELIYKSLTVMNDDEGQSQQGDQEFAIRLRNMLKNMDENNDGRVSLDEFVEAFLSIPCDIIPVEFDLPAIAMGEMVACLFVALGVFRVDALSDKVFFHPQSFSSASMGEVREMQKETKKSKLRCAVAKISKDNFANRDITTFKKDIALRLK